MLRGFAGDLRLAIRSLRSYPAVSIAAVLTLTLGIGVTTATFSVANGFVLRSLPVRDPHNLVTITSGTALRHGFQAGAGWSYAMWERFRQLPHGFDGAFAWTLERTGSFRRRGDAARQRTLRQRRPLPHAWRPTRNRQDVHGRRRCAWWRA